MRPTHLFAVSLIVVGSVGCGSSTSDGSTASASPDGGSAGSGASAGADDGGDAGSGGADGGAGAGGSAGAGGGALDGGDASDDGPADTLSVQLGASSANVVAAGTVTLTATAQAVGATLGKLEIYEGTTLLSTQYGSPATYDVSFVEGDNGTHTYTAKAYTSKLTATSQPVTVTVAIPADPCGANATACVAATCAPSKCMAPTNVPTGFGSFSRAAGIQDVTLSGALSFNTSVGAVPGKRPANADPTIYEVRAGIGFVNIPQSGNEPSLGVFVFQSLALQGAAITFVGGSPAVFAVAKDATVDATSTIDVGAKGTVPGPGGFIGGSYAKNGTGCAFGGGSTSGGGGAGFGTSGSAGGAGAGGSALSCNAYSLLSPLRGGSGAGGGDDSDSSLAIAFGGGGGGAFQLSAFGTLQFDGIVDAGGGGGRTPEGNGRSGAGGGAGGAIRLESPDLRLGATAGLYANGGGGGSSSAGTGSSCGGALAQDGQASLVPASGSHCGASAGGDGAAGSTAAQPGGGGGWGGGGGGGGLGRIVLATLPGVTPTLSTTELSPGPAQAGAYQVVNTLGQ